MGQGEPTKAAQAIGSACDLAASAWARLWGVQLIAAAGAALVFISLRGPMPPSAAHGLWQVGWAMTLASWAPLWAGLHRLALGGAAAERIWPGGLQFGPTELRFLGLGLAFALAAALTVLPLIGLSALSFVFLRPLGAAPLGPLGQVQASFIATAFLWAAVLVVAGRAAARFMLAPAATVSRKRLTVSEVWSLSRGRTGAILAAWATAQAPALAAFALLALVDPVERAAAASASRWLLPDAVLGGALLGGVLAFVHAPLTSGALAALYRQRRAERARSAAVPPAGAGALFAATLYSPRLSD